MKKALWVAVAVAIAVAGAWGYGALARLEDDDGRLMKLLAVAEEQSLVVSAARAGRIVARVPEEGETVRAGETVVRIEEPGLLEDVSDYERQGAQVRAREETRREEVSRLRAELAQAASEERRLSRLVTEGIAPSADLETLLHRREAVEAAIRAREAEKAQLEAEEGALAARTEKVRRFTREGSLQAPTSGTVLSRHHREGEWVEAGEPILTVQVESPYLRLEVPEERLSGFAVGARVVAYPQARPQNRFRARVVSVKPRSEYATRKNWGLNDRDLKTFSVRLAPEGATVVSGQTFVVEAGGGKT